MRNINSIQMVLLLSGALMLTVEISTIKADDVYWNDGNGSAESPFEIAEPNQLIVMSQHPEHWDKCFILTADINLALAEPNTFNTAVIAPDMDNSNHDFDGTPFTGVFDGNGHTISNLTIDDAGAGNDYLGLFGYTNGATIKKLGLQNVDVNGGYGNFLVGGLCGSNSGIITECYANGSVTGGEDAMVVGGLCGDNYYGSISKCFTSVSVIGGYYSSNLGGLCGYDNEGNISNCYANGSVTGGDNSFGLGGLCGGNYISSISNCYSTSFVAGGERSHNLSGLCGFTFSSNISHCFWDIEVSNQAHSEGGYGRTTLQMQNAVTFVGWGDGNWVLPAGDYPRLSWENTGGTPLENIPIRTYTGNGTQANPFILASSADLLCLAARQEDWSSFFTLPGDIDMSSVSSYLPIGNFTGELDGRNNRILNLTVNEPGSSLLGVIGQLGKGGDIKNLGVENAHIDGFRYSGGLCGYNFEGSIRNCYSTGSVIGNDHLGGLCGNNCDGNISYCFSTISITGNDYLGGLCGRNRYDGSISNCYSTGSITGYDYLGGLCGRNESYGKIRNCYSTGSVNGDDYFGGLCGKSLSQLSIRNCYFLDTAGPHNGYGTPLTDNKMKQQSSFAGWDFDPNDGDPADWYMSVGDYPKLDWQQTITYYGQTQIALAKSNSGTILIDVYSRIDEVLNWTITGHESCSWITSLSPDNGVSTGPTDLTTVTIDIDTATLNYGNHFCELILTADNGDNVILFVRLHILLEGEGTQANPFLIDNFDSFLVFTNSSLYWESEVYTRLDCDIDLDPTLPDRQIYRTAVIAPDTYNLNHGFDGTPFKGIFYGSDHTISNLTINTHGTGNYYLGLFGKIEGSDAKVTNLGLVNVYITGGYLSDYLGGLCGENYYGSISNSYATSSVTGSKLSSYLGGLCGHNSGSISNCYATSSVTGGENSSSIGGLCGLNFGSISNCYATSSVTGGDRSRHLGGLCGRNSVGSILNCYATGSVNGAHQLGGLCGGNWRGIISNCYATGPVTGDRYLGGLCGENTGNIINCYSTGLVSHGWPTAGFCGYSSGSVIKCYFLDTAGLDNGLGIPLTDSQMKKQASFVGWDFIGETANGIKDIWFIPQEDYPHLWWEGMEVSSMKITPRTLNCRSKGKWVKAHLTLPEGFTVADVDPNRPAVLHSFGFASAPLDVFVNENKRVEIEAAFEREALCSLAGDWPDALTVAGFLTDGNVFLGTSTVRVITPGLKELVELSTYWLEEGCQKLQWCNGMDINQDSVVNLRDFALFQNGYIEIYSD